MRLEDRPVGRVRAGDRTAVGEGELATTGGSPNLEDDDRDIPAIGLAQLLKETLRVADRLQEHTHDPGRRLIDQEVEVIGRRSYELLAGRNAVVHPEVAGVLGDGGEHGATVGDEADRAGRRTEVVRVARQEERVDEVVEAHAAGAEDRHPGGAGDVRDPCPVLLGRQLRRAGRRPKDDAASDARRGDRLQGREEPLVGEADRGKVDGARLRDGPSGREAVDLVVARVDGHDAAGVAAVAELAEDVTAERVRLRAGADDRDGPGSQEGFEVVRHPGYGMRSEASPRRSSERAMINRWISLVPSQIRSTR